MAGVPSQFVNIDEATLRNAGFVDSGVTQYKRAVSDFAEELRERTIAYADAQKGVDLPREATHEHVRQASMHLSANLGKTGPHFGKVFLMAGEYLCAAIAGAGAGHLDKQEGIFAFGLGLAVGLVLLGVRHIALREV